MGVNGIYGLSGSGLDIESMVKVGMMSKQNEYDKMAQKYTLNEWKKADYIALNNQITTFNMSSLTDYKLASKMKAKTATSSNEAAVTATANSNATAMSHKVSVKELSHNAYLIGDNSIADVIAQVKGKTADQVQSLASEAKLSDVLFNNLKYGPVTVTTDYQTTPTSGSSYSPLSSSTKTSLSINRDGDGKVDFIEYKGAGNNDTSTLYEVRDVTTNETNTETTTYTDTNSKTLILTATTEINNGTSSSTTYKINVNDGDEKEYTLDSNNTRDKYVSTDGTSTIRMFKDTNGNITGISIGADAYDSNNPNTSYANSSTTTTSSTKTETIYTENDGPTVTVKSKDRAVTSIQAQKTETGVTASTFGGTYLSSGYSSGQVPLVQKNDTAIAFTISDGTKTTAEISFTYEDLIDGINGKDVTMNDLVSKIKTEVSKAGMDIKAEYDNLNGVFSIYNSNGNDESAVIIKPVAGNTTAYGALSRTNTVTTGFLNALNLKEFDGTTLKATSSSYEAWGNVGKITVDGKEYSTKDNKVTVGGITYTALGSTEDATGVDRPATVTVGQDVDAIVDKVKSFVESYNKILGDLYAKYDEKSDSNYKPLTQSQKDSMKEEQIEKWEEKAKQGLLYHDSTLSKIINDMRNAVVSSVEVDDKTYSIFNLGISTTGLKGQLTLDEEKLRNALDEDGDVVYNVFSKLTTKTENGKEVTDYDKSGIAQRLGDIFTNATKLIKSRAGSSSDIAEDSDLNNLLRELQTKMSNFKKLMSAFEDKLYKKYDAMEVALTKLGTQLSFITGGQ